MLNSLNSMVINLSKKDYVITKIILAIGLIPFSFYMLEGSILRGTLLDSIIGVNLLGLIFSVMSFFLTIALLSLSICFTDIGNNHKIMFFKFFNNLFDAGVFFSVGLFLLSLIGIISNIIRENWSVGILKFIEQNFELIVIFVLIGLLVFVYSKYYKKLEGGK